MTENWMQLSFWSPKIIFLLWNIKYVPSLCGGFLFIKFCFSHPYLPPLKLPKSKYSQGKVALDQSYCKCLDDPLSFLSHNEVLSEFFTLTFTCMSPCKGMKGEAHSIWPPLISLFSHRMSMGSPCLELLLIKLFNWKRRNTFFFPFSLFFFFARPCTAQGSPQLFSFSCSRIN